MSRCRQYMLFTASQTISQHQQLFKAENPPQTHMNNTIGQHDREQTAEWTQTASINYWAKKPTQPNSHTLRVKELDSLSLSNTGLITDTCSNDTRPIPDTVTERHRRTSRGWQIASRTLGVRVTFPAVLGDQQLENTLYKCPRIHTQFQHQGQGLKE